MHIPLREYNGFLGLCQSGGFFISAALEQKYGVTQCSLVRQDGAGRDTVIDKGFLVCKYVGERLEMFSS